MNAQRQHDTMMVRDLSIKMTEDMIGVLHRILSLADSDIQKTALMAAFGMVGFETAIALEAKSFRGNMASENARRIATFYRGLLFSHQHMRAADPVEAALGDVIALMDAGRIARNDDFLAAVRARGIDTGLSSAARRGAAGD